ncbi:hypothetical protein [Pseudaestuariivita rosea]|uniref:hypothetical protein n=1 Tax=Pseudaestuariivita rosea TaxID=2763263 RepID=UPI001ABAF5ED|nr:hypothetical protein [Pseudaestuariivita rosea]
MRTHTILIAAAVSALPGLYGLGYVQGTGACNAQRIKEAFGELSQGVLMNTPLISILYKLGLKSGIEGNCSEDELVALVFTGQSDLINLDTPEALR